mgnify:CR=1 FL=1
MNAGTIVAAVVFGFFAGWDVWEALGNLVGLPAYYQAINFGEFVPWAIVIPGFGFALVALIGGLWWIFRSQQRGAQLVGAAVILATSAALQLSVLAAEQAWRAAAIQGLLLSQLG